MGHRESTLAAGLGGLRDGLHNTFVKGDNWLNKGYQRNEKDWFGRDGRDSTIVAGLGAFVDGLHDTFVKGDNWLNRWYQKKEWQLEKAADASVARGNGMLDTFGVLLATAIGVDDLFGVGDRSNTLDPMIVGFVDGLPDVFYHGDNWAHRAYEAEAEHLDNAAELFGERGDSTAEAFFGLGGVIISDAAGTTELYEAGSDQDLVAFVEDGNHHDLTDEEQILKGVTGGVKLLGAGMQGAGWSQSVRTAITASRIGTLEAQAAAKAAQLGNPAKLANSTRPVLSGHGSGVRGTTFQNPNNVTVRFHSGYSKPLDNVPANYIEMGIGTGPATRVYGPGQEVPEHMLYAIKESWVIRGPGVQTVTQPTKLSDLITQLAKDNPGQQIVVEWAACRGVIDNVAERVAGTIVVMAANGCSDEIAEVGDGKDQTTLIR
ncbi:MAG: hypothetical protein JRD03_08780 [Deltaproteobacteria bacterium]|nr:hypothetical protein [Deltaproteobacteria bacterium]